MAGGGRVGQSRAHGGRGVRHLDRIWDYDPDHPNDGRIEIVGAEIMEAAARRRAPRPVLHRPYRQWELNAITGAKLGVPGGVLYRAPNIKKAADLIAEMRAQTMPGLVKASRNAGRQMARMLEDGEHIGMLVDQYWGQGVVVDFFGRPAATNPTLARLARQFDCPVHGMRVIRLPRAGGSASRSPRKCPAPRRGRPHRGGRRHAGRHQGESRTGAGISEPVALAAPPLALRTGARRAADFRPILSFNRNPFYFRGNSRRLPALSRFSSLKMDQTFI